jgi:hypothetical protein
MKNLVKVLALLCAIFAWTGASAQAIKPGVGVGSLKLGMSQAHARNQLARQESARDFEEERESFESAGYEVHLELVFVLGFDSVVQFNNTDETDMPLPVYKTYFSNDALSYITLTSYGYLRPLAEKVKVKGIQMFSPVGQVKKKLGEPDLRIDTSDVEYELFYLDKGLMFSVDEEQVRAMHLFPKLDAAQQAEFLALHP